jgi:hypothetical protein
MMSTVADDKRYRQQRALQPITGADAMTSRFRRYGGLASTTVTTADNAYNRQLGNSLPMVVTVADKDCYRRAAPD